MSYRGLIGKVSVSLSMRPSVLTSLFLIKDPPTCPKGPPSQQATTEKLARDAVCANSLVLSTPTF